MLQHSKGYHKNIRLIKTGRLGKQKTQKKGKRQKGKLTTCAVNVQVQAHIQSIINPICIYPGFKNFFTLGLTSARMLSNSRPDHQMALLSYNATNLRPSVCRSCFSQVLFQDLGYYSQSTYHWDHSSSCARCPVLSLLLLCLTALWCLSTAPSCCHLWLQCLAICVQSRGLSGYFIPYIAITAIILVVLY